ncbi:MAG: hypothetical protein ACM34K_04925 [Bacillota bacterium]
MTHQILEMAEKLQYVSASNHRLKVLIDGKTVQVNEDEFTKLVQTELQAGKTLVSAIRDTVFRRIKR